jgi:GTPase SAR1 family protein
MHFLGLCEGELMCVVGPVASGKSSLIASLLGETYRARSALAPAGGGNLPQSDMVRDFSSSFSCNDSHYLTPIFITEPHVSSLTNAHEGTAAAAIVTEWQGCICASGTIHYQRYSS